MEEIPVAASFQWFKLETPFKLKNVVTILE
jgi:hypothetical protein